jgi:hypothetical protein
MSVLYSLNFSSLSKEGAESVTLDGPAVTGEPESAAMENDDSAAVLCGGDEGDIDESAEEAAAGDLSESDQQQQQQQQMEEGDSNSLTNISSLEVTQQRDSLTRIWFKFNYVTR